MNIAILYQAKKPPAIDGIDKPMKKGGYSDSGADIAYCLLQNHYSIITPVENPDVYQDLDWVFPDTKEGIQQAIDQGADTLWLNTVLYATHPILEFKGINIIGQDPYFVEKYDNKLYTNQLLYQHGLDVVESKVIDLENIEISEYPCVIKPIRGRGSQGVKVCDNLEEVINHMNSLIQDGNYGNRFIVEPFLNDTEITIGVFPDGKVIPPIERIKQIDRIMPYNGKVPVVENSFVCKDNTDEIIKQCQKAIEILKPKAMVRIDCRKKDGKYYMFDINPKPNMTGASRPHRQNQDSLLMIGMKENHLTYIDLIKKYISYQWKNI